MARVRHEVTFDPMWLVELTDYSLIADTLVEGFLAGLHRGLFQGFGLEFVQYRPYSAGDDLKFIDWKVYARRRELRVKMFQEETNCRTCILIDQSGSMAYGGEGRPSKLEFAKIIAAAIINLAYRQTDFVGLYSYNEQLRVELPPAHSRDWRQRMYLELQRIDACGESKPAQVIPYFVEHLKQRGIVVVISDFLDDDFAMIRQLRLLRSAHHEVIILQVLDDDELELPFTGTWRFVDAETRDELITFPDGIRESYRERLDRFLAKVKREALANEMDYMLLRTGMNPVNALRAWLHRRINLK